MMNNMNDMSRDVYLVQNPAIGAAILWRFVSGYYNMNSECRPVPFPLLFITLPIIFREDLRDVISSTNKSSGLQKVSEKLFSSKHNDLFYSIQDSAFAYKEITLLSIKIALQAGLIDLSCKTALVAPLQVKTHAFSTEIQNMLKSSEKLGAWCAPLSLHEISILLKVRF